MPRKKNNQAKRLADDTTEARVTMKGGENQRYRCLKQTLDKNAVALLLIAHVPFMRIVEVNTSHCKSTCNLHVLENSCFL